MTLYLMRHAEAVEPGTNGTVRDADRKLTDKGRRQAQRVGALLKRMDVRITVVLASPFARAHETAELVASALGSDLRVRTLGELKPNARDEALWDAIRSAGGEGVLAVGHLPSLARFAGSLLGSLADQPLWFHKSSLAALHCEERADRPPRVKLEWMLSPALVKRLAPRHASASSATRSA